MASDPVPVVPAELSLVTVPSFLDFLHLTDVDEVTRRRLTEALTAATEWVEQQVGPLGNAAVTYTVFPSGRYLVLPDTHFVDVASVTGPDGRPVDVDPAGLNLLAGVIEFGHRLPRGPYEVVATTREHGEAVATAVKVIASHLYDLHRGTLTDARAALMEPVADTAGRTGFAIPRRALDLLRPFRRPVL